MHVFSITLWLFGSSGAVNAQSPPPAQSRLTESDALKRFVASDPRLRALQARIDEVRAAQAERTLWPNPSVTYSRESVSNAHDTFLLARQELPVSGQRARLRVAGERAVEAAQAEARAERLRLQTALRDAYTKLVLAQERESTVRQSITSLQELIAMLRAREDAGEGSSYDRMRGARALLDLEADLAAARIARAQAQGELASFFGRDIDPETVVAADPLALPEAPVDVATLIAQALASRGEFRAAESSIAQFEAERLAATRLRVPTPSITGGLKQSDFSGSSASGFQLSIDVAVPVFSHGQAAGAVARASKARAEADAESWRARIEADVRAANAVLAIQLARANTYRDAAAQVSEPLATVARVGYEEGELGILELLDAERQALDARLRLLALAADARRAAIELDRVVGVELRP
jgi:cobalt-zinc-cadmium efflux system outer membrane protein